MKIRIILADDLNVSRTGIRLILDAQRDLEVVGEAADGDELVRMAAELKPDVVAMELAMLGERRFRTISDTCRAHPEGRVLVLTIHDDAASARSALAAGAVGYVAKKVSKSELLAAIRAVHRGRAVVNVSLKPQRLATRSRAGTRRSASLPIPPGHSLSERERQVLDLLARGHTSRGIAERLGVSVKTAETYRSRIAEKLGLLTRADIVAYALDIGLLTSERPAGKRGP